MRKKIGALLTSLTIVGCLQSQHGSDNSERDRLLTFGLLLMNRTANFVMVGSSCGVWGSEDGLTWTQGHLPGCQGSGAIKDVTYGNGLYVVVGSVDSALDTCGLWTSPNGYFWTQQNCQVPANLTSVAYWDGLRRFAVGSAWRSGLSTCPVALSDDGIRWYLASAAPTCTFGEQSRSMAAAQGGYMSLTSATSSSTNGATGWANTANQSPLPTTSSLQFVSSSRIAILGSVGPQSAVQTTDDQGGSWNPITYPGSFEILRSGTRSDGGEFVAVGDNCSLAVSYSNADFWEPDTNFGYACTGVNWVDVAYGSNVFVAVGHNASMNGVVSTSGSGRQHSWEQGTLDNYATIHAVAARR